MLSILISYARSHQQQHTPQSPALDAEGGRTLKGLGQQI